MARVVKSNLGELNCLRKMTHDESMMLAYGEEDRWPIIWCGHNRKAEHLAELGRIVGARCISKFTTLSLGEALSTGLNNARWQADGIAIWEEEDYCSPPLAMERAAVLDKYFDAIRGGARTA